MHQSWALPELASLLGRDSYGYRYGVPVESVKDVGLSGELKAEKSSVDAFSDTVNIERPGSSEESVLLQSEICCGEIHDVYSKDAPIVVHDMPIVGTSSLENQVGPLVADARWNSLAESLQESALGVHGCASVKRERSHQELEEARAEKRVKVEGNGGLPCSFVNGNGLVPTVPHRGVEDCQGANAGVKERDDLRPLVQGTGISVSAPKDTDLTDLLNDLDDAGDSDLEDDEFGDDSHLWPEAFCDEWLGIGTISGNEVLAHMPEAEIIAKALNVSAEQMHRDGVKGAMLQGHSPEVKSSTEALVSSSEQAQSNGDVRSLVPAQSSQPGTITKALGSLPEQAQSNGEIGSMVQSHSSEPETVSNAFGSSSGQAQRNGDVRSLVPAQSSQPETITKAPGILPEQAQSNGEIGSMVQSRSSEPETISNALDSSSGQAQRNGDVRSMVQTHSLQPDSITKAPGFLTEETQREGEIGSTVQAQSSQPETITKAPGFLAEQVQRNGEFGTTVSAHSLQPETVTEALGFSSEQAQRDGETEIVVQAHEERSGPLIVILDSDSDDDDDDGFMMFDYPVETSQVKNTVKVEPGAGKLEKCISQLNDAVKIEPESVRQPERQPEKQPEKQPERSHLMGSDVKVEPEIVRQPERSHLMGNAVKVEPEIVRQPERSHLMENAVKVEPEIVRQPERSHLMGNAVKVEPEIVRQPESSHQLGNTVMVEPEILRQPERSHQLGNTVKEEPEILRQPEKSSQLRNAVKVEAENLRQPEKSSEFVPNEISEFVPNETSELVPNEISELVPRESSHLASVVNSELANMRQAADSRGSHGFEAPTMQGMHRPGQELRGFVLQTIVQDGKLLWALVPQNPDTTLGSPYSVNHMDPTPPQVNGLPNRPPNGLPYGLPYGLGCSSGPRSVRESFPSFAEQAGPSHSWIPPTTSADVPSYRGHAQPSGMGNGNHAIADQAVVSVPRPSLPAGDIQDAAASRDQAGPSHDWTPPDSSAVVPYRYDSTVSTPRVNVTRVLQQYLICINKAKDAISARALAERESTSDEPVKEGNRRGLDCRPDIVAYNDIKRANAGVNPGVNVGDLPGVQVGDTFTYRHQMAIVGLHRLPNVGIDYGRPPPDMIPTATAIVMMPKAGYVDDKDWGDKLLYTGQGGRKKRNQQAPFVQDQILTKGNLALAKNFERKLPVRVIRGHFGNGSNGPGVLGYSYDGLYTILKYELGDGINGFKVYKFLMERLEDQPPIPPCIAGCTAHAWNTLRKAPADVVPLQAKDPTVDVKPICMQDLPVDVKPICMQDPPVDVKPIFMQEPPVEMKQICI